MSVIERVPVDAAAQRVTAALGDRAAAVGVNFDHVDVVCRREELVGVMETLRDHDDLRCTYFGFLSGVDYSEFGDAPGQLEVVVHVYSPEFTINVTVHVPLSFEDAVCPSITDVYKGALWPERETFEMFGIEFEGHPRLVRLYLPEDFEGHPLLKSFHLPTRRIKEWPGAKDPEEAAAGGR